MMRSCTFSGSSRGLPALRAQARQAGVTVILVLAFMGVFALVLSALTGFVLQQSKYGRALYVREQAFQIAEAGLEYYRWFLARNPTIMTAGVGLETPYTYTVKDPEGPTLGTSAITAVPGLSCGAVQWIDLESEGTASADQSFSRTLAARYMRPSVAEYAFLYNTTVWFGSTNTGVGPYHANNGMRMDGTTNSITSASVSQVYCDNSYGSMGCSGTGGNPSAGWKNGVFGNSANTTLWMYPVPSVNFANMAVNFATLRSYAQADGVMLNPTSVTRDGVQMGSTFTSVGANDQRGFHLTFLSNGTVDVRRVTATNSSNSINSYNDVDGSYYNYPVIVSDTLVSNVSIPSNCAIIFSQAKTWIDGVVSGKVTVIAADTGSYVPDIILNGNLTYATNDGTSGLTAVAEGSVHVGLVVPTDMTVSGIFVAQTGQYGRDYYASGSMSSSYDPYITRNSLTVNGTIVSALRGGICWGTSGSCASGFNNRTNTYDRVLAFSPPPFTPAVSTDYEFTLWREE